MKRYLLALFYMVNISIVFGDEPLFPIPLLISGSEIVDGNLGGHRSPVRPENCPIQLFIDKDLLILQFVGIGELDIVSYVIKSSDEEVVLSDELNNIEHQVDISSLCPGAYYIEVLYNGILYIGELTLV